MAQAVCSKCEVGWTIHSYDKYCGYCGCKVFDFSLKWEKDPWIYAEKGDSIRELTLLVENTGAYPITFQPVQTTREGAVAFPRGNTDPFEVEAGECYPVPIQVKPANLARTPEVITVKAQGVPANFESEKTLSLEVLPLPQFEVTPNPAEVRYRKSTQDKLKRLELHLEVIQSKFYITGIKANHPSVRNLLYSNRLHEENGATKKLLVEIDCERLIYEVEVGEIELSFQLRDLSQPIKKIIGLRKKKEPEPPKLYVPFRDYDITQGREKTDTLTLQNSGEKPLIVQNIIFNTPSTLIKLPDVKFPLSIEGGQHCDINMLISAVGIEPDTYPVNFTVSSNCNINPEYEGSLRINVKEQKEYPHYLAIDFGTTNSCCAYLGSKDRPELIPLDDRADPPEIIPSSIVYHSQPRNGEVYKVGYDADTDKTSLTDGPYYVRSVKRWLGYNWNRPFPNNQKLQPSDVVSDILIHIIERAEEHIIKESEKREDRFNATSTESKIKRCVIAHPTMFRRKQLEDIRQAVEKLGITDIRFIDEASAASFGIVSQEQRTGNYKLLVYDFGGGTIDIVLSDVEKDGNHATIEPLAHGGDPKYGGDDVTHAIVKFVLTEIEQRIKKESPNLRYDIPYLSPREVWHPSGHKARDDATVRNTAFLYREAESLKKKLCNPDQVSPDFSTLEALVENERKQLFQLFQLVRDETAVGNLTDDLTVSISKEDLRALIEDKLQHTFADIDAMIRDNGGHLPEIVILAGQSSKMPIVKEMMVEHFKSNYETEDIDIQLSETPKECVAIGAAEYGMTLLLPGATSIEIVNSHRTRASIGIMQYDGKQRASVFKEIIPAGSLIPDESCGTLSSPLTTGDTIIDVRERFGENNTLSRIDSYTLTLPDDVPRQALRDASIKMSVEDDDRIRVAAVVDGCEKTFTVERKDPEFADEI